MLALLALSPAAWPCAGLVTPDHTEDLASSDAQQAILAIGTDSVSAEYRVRYSGNASDFAWIIPVPGKVDSVEEGSEARFTAIEEATAPTVAYWSPEEEEGSTGCGCAGSSDKAGGLRGDNFGDDTAAGGVFGAEPSGVTIVGTGYAGPFEYTLLEAEQADGFLQWLQDQGYDTSLSEPSIQAYVDDGIAFSWVAVELAPDAPTTPDGGVVLPPLRITWSAGDDGVLHASYPARMAATSMLSEIRTELYVMAGSRVDLGSGWSAAGRDYEDYHYSYDMNGNAGDDPAEVYADALRSYGGSQSVLWPAWGGMYTDEVAGDVYLTRFDAIVAPAANHDDVTFSETGETWGFSTLIGIPESTTPAGIWLLPLGVGGLLLRRKK